MTNFNKGDLSDPRAIYAKAGVKSRFELASLIQNGLAPLARFELED